MSHSPEFIEKMEERLLEEKARLERDLGDIGEKNPEGWKVSPEYPESGGNSDDDNAMEVSEYSDELSLDARLEKELRDVEKALESVKKGTYGICKYCNKDIQEKRLEARPASSSCISCKKVLTQEM